MNLARSNSSYGSIFTSTLVLYLIMKSCILVDEVKGFTDNYQIPPVIFNYASLRDLALIVYPK